VCVCVCVVCVCVFGCVSLWCLGGVCVWVCEFVYACACI